MVDPSRARLGLIEALDPVARATRTLAGLVARVTALEAAGRLSSPRAATLRCLAAARFAAEVSGAPVAASSPGGPPEHG